MFHKTCENIIQKAVDNQIVQDSFKQEYIYGLELSISAFISYSTIVIIGVTVHMTVEAIAFLIIYTTMRRYIGGFHFNSQIICYLSNFVVCPLVLMAIKYIDYNTILYNVVFTFAASILWCLSPVPADNKPIDEKEKKIYRRISYFLIISAAVAYIICLMFNNYAIKVLTTSITMVALFAIAGKLKLKLKKH